MGGSKPYNLKYRFERHIRRSEDGHWYWTGRKCRNGYGTFLFDGKEYTPHRFSMYFYKEFDLSSNFNINHKPECNIRSCVNPDHLYIGTQKENMRDVSTLGNHHNLLKTHCPRGHNYSIRPDGRRYCIICDTAGQRRRRKARKYGQI